MQFSIPMLAFALLTASFLWPAEDAVNGSGLHLVVLWLLLGMFHALRQFRRSPGQSESSRASFGLMDLGVLLIAAGHVISTIVVFQVDGDRRAAVNLTFEWIGLFVAWRLFRSLLLDRIAAVQTVTVVVAIAVGLSTLGIWQHSVEQQARTAWYLPLRTELDAALSKQDGSGFLRAREIVAAFHEQGIPPEALDGPARILWENRLLSSTEPLGTFSLTNTLAGILATALVLQTGLMTAALKVGRHRNVWRGVFAALQMGTVAYCLMLTKSRSAWAGAVAGLTVLAIVRSRAGSLMKVFRWGITGGLVVAVTAGTAAFFGALDKEVILESPRSFQYRLMYWTGAIELLKEHPLAGAGPGNFRQLYLEHKVDESSEEIRDPHNFVLDAWSSAGVTGLAGLLLLIVVLCRQLTNEDTSVEDRGSTSLARRRSWRIVAVGMALGFGLQAGWDWINGFEFSWDEGIRLLLLAGAAVFVLVSRTVVRVDAVTGRAAASTMMVHLLAAGGFEMPAVMLLLLVCLALGVPLKSPESFAARAPERDSRKVHFGRFARWMGLPVAATLLCGVVAVVKLGLLSVTAADRQMQKGDDALHRLQIPQFALDNYRLAAESDPVSVTPRQRIAELETYRLTELLFRAESQSQNVTVPTQEFDGTEESAAETQLQIAIAAAESLISADRRSCVGYRIRSKCLAAGSMLLKNSEMMERAIADQQNVTQMYPSSVEDWRELAVLSHTADAAQWSDVARQAASRALELELINRQWGHRDQYLPADQLNQLQEIVAESL